MLDYKKILNYITLKLNINLKNYTGSGIKKINT